MTRLTNPNMRNVPNPDRVWRSRDGKEYKLRDMDMEHLLNAEAWARRRVCELETAIAEAADDACEGASFQEAIQLSAVAAQAAGKARFLQRWVSNFREEINRREREAMVKLDTTDVESRVLAHMDEMLRREVRDFLRRRG